MPHLFSLPFRGAGAALRSAMLVTFILGASLGAAQAADPIPIGVTLDHAQVLQLPDKTATVIVGNPVIADVTMLKKSNTIVLTGKGFGETNLIALDAQGKALGESIVRVTGAENLMVVQRGMERDSYTCMPRCQPTVNLGDTPEDFTNATSQIKSRNDNAQPAH